MLNQVESVETARGDVPGRRRLTRAAAFVAALAEKPLAPLVLPAQRTGRNHVGHPALGPVSPHVRRASPSRRRQSARPSTSRSPRAPSPRALVPAARQAVLAAWHHERCIDQSPADSRAVILDRCSRDVVGWMVAVHERAPVAERRIEAMCASQGIALDQLTMHADRGAPMRSNLLARLFSDLGIEASHSRPRVSHDNPFSESQFRTLKYRPEFPDRFGSVEYARAVSHDLFAWYNDASHHSGFSYLTPADVHDGRADTILDVRHRARLAAYAAHPERFVKGPPRHETLPTAVGSMRRQKRLARMPQERRSPPRTTRSMGSSSSHTSPWETDQSCSSTAWSRYSKFGIRLSQKR